MMSNIHNHKRVNRSSSAQIVDFFQEECADFKSTPKALDFQNNKKTLFPSGIREAFQDSPSVPVIEWEKSISNIINEAKQKVLSNVVLDSIMTNLTLCKNEDIISTTEIILVSESDCGKVISVFNGNWLFLTPALQIDKPFLTDCMIPNNDEKDSEKYKLGCYIPQYRVIFLWVDRIYNAANNQNINANLLFQEVLLHELIHALIDFNLRDQDLNVFGITDPEKIEETITNTLMLKVYYDSCKISFDEILKFVKTQSLPYSSATKVFDLFQSTHGWGNFIDILGNYLVNKATVNKQSIAQAQYFGIENGEDTLSEEDHFKNWVAATYYHLGRDPEAWSPFFDNTFYHKDILIKLDCPFFLVNNVETFVNRVSIYRGILSTGEKILKLFFTFCNKSHDSVYIVTYDAIKDTLNVLDNNDNNQNAFSFKSHELAVKFCNFLLKYPFACGPTFKTLDDYYNTPDV